MQQYAEKHQINLEEKEKKGESFSSAESKQKAPIGGSGLFKSPSFYAEMSRQNLAKNLIESIQNIDEKAVRQLLINTRLGKDLVVGIMHGVLVGDQKQIPIEIAADRAISCKSAKRPQAMGVLKYLLHYGSPVTSQLLKTIETIQKIDKSLVDADLESLLSKSLTTLGISS